MFFKLKKEVSRTIGQKAALAKEQFRLDTRKYALSQRVINELNKLSNDCVNASSMNMFRNRIDIYLIRAGYTQMIKLLDTRQANINGFPYPLAIWNLFGKAILLNLFKYGSILVKWLR